MFQLGGVMLTFMSKSFWKRDLFHHGLYLYQRVFLWLKYRKYGLDSIVTKTFARCSHVQLDLGEHDQQAGAHLFLNVTYPDAKFEVYDHVRLANEPRQAYCTPRFVMDGTHQVKMREFATDLIQSPRKKAYDWLQLFSYILNLIIWAVRPLKWGQEVNHMLNLPGGKQVCSSGAAACLRYAEVGTISQSLREDAFEIQQMVKKAKIITSKTTSNFFKGYDTAMVSPVVFLMEGKWDNPGDIFRVDQ